MSKLTNGLQQRDGPLAAMDCPGILEQCDRNKAAITLAVNKKQTTFLLTVCVQNFCCTALPHSLCLFHILLFFYLLRLSSHGLRLPFFVSLISAFRSMLQFFGMFYKSLPQPFNFRPISSTQFFTCYTLFTCSSSRRFICVEVLHVLICVHPLLRTATFLPSCWCSGTTLDKTATVRGYAWEGTSSTALRTVSTTT